MKKILIATDINFWSDNRGSCKRISILVKFLVSRGFDLLVVYTNQLNSKTLIDIENSYGIRIESLVKTKLPRRLYIIQSYFKKAKKIFLKVFARIFPFHKNFCQFFFREKKLRDFKDTKKKFIFSQILFNEQPDCVIIEYIRLAYLIEDIPLPLKKIIDTHDVMHCRYERFKSAGQNHWIAISREEEAAVLKIFDCVMAIQGREKKIFEELVGDEVKVILLGMALDIKSSWNVLNYERGYIKIGYIAGGDISNIVGLEKFIANVLVKLSSDLPFLFCVGGMICEHVDFRDIDCLQTCGQIDDLNKFYQNIDIVVNPVLFGGGLKIKNVEALCYGKPLITTPLGAEGLEDGIGTAFLVANDDGEFIRQLQDLWLQKNLRKKLAECAHEYALRHFSEDVVYAELLSFLNVE